MKHILEDVEFIGFFCALLSELVENDEDIGRIVGVFGRAQDRGKYSCDQALSQSNGEDSFLSAPI